MNRKNWLLTLLGGLIILVAAACTTAGNQPVEPGAPLLPTVTPEFEPDEAGANLPGSSWDLVSIDGELVSADITLEFRENEVFGSDGCNGYGASYTVDGSQISFDTDGFVSTLMACEETIMQEGSAYLQALRAVESFKWEFDSLWIESANGTLQFSEAVPAMIENTRWVLTGTVVGGDAFVHSVIDSEIYIKINDGQVEGYLGCNNLGGMVTVDGSAISFDQMAITEMYCGDEERNQRESTVLELLRQTTTFTIERGTLSFLDDNGLLLMTFREETEMRGETLLFVGPELIDCVGVGPQTCLQIKEDPEADWTLFYDSIERFEFEPGFEYTLRVNISEVENLPADASSLHYELIEVVEKTAVE